MRRKNETIDPFADLMEDYKEISAIQSRLKPLIWFYADADAIKAYLELQRSKIQIMRTFLGK